MATMNFPDTPAVDELYTAPNGVQYQYDGSVWNVVAAAAGVPGPVGPEGPAGADGKTGPEGPAGKQGKDGVPCRFMGRINTYTDLEAIRPGAKGGQIYITNDTGEGYFALAIDDPNVVTAWEFMGRLVGADGAQGVDGAQGPAGEVGPVGPAGADGAEGPAGPTGPQGPAGMGINLKGHAATVADLPATAAQGDTYVVDADGNAYSWSDTDGTYLNIGKIVGPQGEQGIQGPQGIQGEVGPQGPAGVDGAQGPMGAQGPAGADGVAGADGKDGADGADGPQGPAGADGAVGPKGDTGADGAPGPTAVSADADNVATLGTDNLIFVPASSGAGGATIVSIADGATEPAAGDYPEGALLVRYTP